ncbi:MAG: hypothetical protein K0Q55_900 [Verrucomicrobia bacterium]|jgi:hypothetical protein|nr:hypothetical protein [Verrucomicrobiota bacterium]
MLLLFWGSADCPNPQSRMRDTYATMASQNRQKTKNNPGSEREDATIFHTSWYAAVAAGWDNPRPKGVI